MWLCVCLFVFCLLACFPFMIQYSRTSQNVKFMYRSIPKPPITPRANPGAFDFLEKFWSNFPLCCQFRRSNAPLVRASKRVNTPPSRHVKVTVETSSATFSATTNFLFSLSSLHALNKGIFHDITTGSPSCLYEPHKEHNMASNYKGLYGIFYKISMKVIKSENIQ